MGDDDNEPKLSLRDLLLQILLENAAANNEEEPVACLITDAMWHFTQAVADSLEIHRIVLRTSSLSAFLAFSALSLLKNKGDFSTQGCQFEALVPEFLPLKLNDIPTIGTNNQDATHLPICNMVEKAKASRGLIFNTFEELEASSLAKISQDNPIPIFVIGPFHKQVPTSSTSLLAQDQTCIAWLDAQTPKSVLYVSFGSIASLGEVEFLEIAWGLANSKQPFLWVIRPGLVRGSGGPAPMPNGFVEMVAGRGQVVGWAPQEEVLAHPAIGAFWTHNGWNSTLESICAGVPMICLPCFGDQMGNARYVTDVWRVGLRLENVLKREDVEKVIRRLIVEEEGEEMRQRIACLKEMASLCIAEGGSSYKSLNSLVAHILSF